MSNFRPWTAGTLPEPLQLIMSEPIGMVSGPRTGPDALVHSLAQSLRYPVNSLPKLLGKLAESSLGQAQRGHIEQLAMHAGEIQSLIADAETFASLHSESPHGWQSTFSIHDLVDEVIETVEERAHRGGTALRGRVTLPSRFKIRAEESLLNAALLKLVNHSVDFTRDGQVVVTIGCENPSSGQPILEIEVRDNGRPVSETALADYFLPGHRSVDDRHGDSGFGLALAHSIVRNLGGALTMVPQRLGGAVFRFTIPTELHPVDDSTPENQPLPCSHTWIIQDRNRPVSLLHSKLVDWCGHCEKVEEPAFWPLLQEAITSAGPNSGSPMLIVVDRRTIPDNLDMARRILSRFNGANLRIVMVTDSSLPPSSSTMSTSGIDGVLTRPMRVAEVRRVIESVLTHRESVVAEAPPSKSVSVHETTKKVRVLLVDDNPINRKVGIRQLERLGYESESATNGQEALDAVVHGKWDIVLMDCMMPVMDGFEATRQIRLHEKTARTGYRRRIPVIALTANVSDRHRQQCVEVGMDDFLGKPVLPEELRTTIDRVLSNPAASAPIGGAENAPTEGDVAPSGGEAPAPNPASILKVPAGVDMARLNEMADGDAAVIEELLLMYLDQTEEQVEQLRAAFAKNDCQIVRRIAHSACGASNSIGVGTFTKELRQLEHQAERGSLAGLEAAMLAVEQGFIEVAAYFREGVLKKAPAPIHETVAGSASTEQPGETHPILNSSMLDAMRTAEGPDFATFVGELERMFRDQAQRHSHDLAEAVTKKRPDLISSAAHALKATGLNLGAERLANICQKIYEIAPGAEWEQIAGEVRHLDREIHIVSDQLRREIEGIRPSQANACK